MRQVQPFPHPQLLGGRRRERTMTIRPVVPIAVVVLERGRLEIATATASTRARRHWWLSCHQRLSSVVARPQQKTTTNTTIGGRRTQKKTSPRRAQCMTRTRRRGHDLRLREFIGFFFRRR